ncbi:MAG: EAL domain-containing protein [Pelovirga sp.]
MKCLSPVELQRVDSAAILLVGDQISLLYSLQALLRINGYQADLATSCTAALAALERHRYQLLLLDLQISNAGGSSLLELVSHSEQDPEIVVLSSDSALVSIKEALRLGAYDFVRKPYQPEELLAAVGRGLERHRYRQQLLRSEQALAESERVHRFIVNNSPDFIYMLDSAGRFTFVNDMVEGLLGYRRHEILGQHFSVMVHPHNAEAACRFFSEQRSGERASRSIEMRLQVNPDVPRGGPDGAELIVELNAMGLYSQNDQGERVFTGTLGHARNISERKSFEAQISHQAYHDPLTRLPNRLLFADRVALALAHAKRNQSKFALIFMDLDRFKQINDSCGHVIGDRVLQLVAERILAAIRSEDTLSRFGGDEFSLLLGDVAEPRDVTAVADKILAALRLPLPVGDRVLHLSGSLGIAIYPDNGTSLEDLLHCADVAMYQAKQTGRDGYSFYSCTMQGCVETPTIVAELQQALQQGQFEVFFQPKIDPENHGIVGMEALLRWRHPRRGLLCPADFIAVAEKSGEIIPIGGWVLTEVCRELARWQEYLPGIRVSLNVSTVELESEAFVDTFARTISGSGLAAESFEVHITEQGILGGTHKAVTALHALGMLGVAIVIDDFGCGHAPLIYLQDLPVKTLMIDRSFVRDIDPQRGAGRIADGIAMMARGLNLTLAAKGVETHAQFEHLRNLGCREVQGHFYGMALPAAATLELLHATPEGIPVRFPVHH